MKNISLAARYRPQTFADVAGQSFITAVLSRAAAENRCAPAYLLSGTRGVGKTTIARIFAKALNCVNAPTAEPCNVCEQCRKITQGIHVDVNEIDGASNNSVDDARSLREHIGYAPMEGRYKVFIVDEAHMLTRHAFNALLKTLEEPPANVVFIFATTEAHKFPVTIISRCQHFIFKHLPEAGIEAHLLKVLKNENISFEDRAIKLIARRAAGSVRDGMSLLDQALAFGGESLTESSARNVLGLAGQEALGNLVECIAARDCRGVAGLARDILNQGVDIGFFLRELAGIWRVLFLLLEAGEAALPALELTEDEARHRLREAGKFTSAHVHAAWQMTLETQRQIIHSPEPGSALELLLLNLAMLPRLIPVGLLPSPVGETGAPGLQNFPQGAGCEPDPVPVSEKARAWTPTHDLPIERDFTPPAASAEIPPITRSASPEAPPSETVPAEGSFAPVVEKADSLARLSVDSFIDICAAKFSSPVLLRNVRLDIKGDEIIMSIPSTTLYEQMLGYSAELEALAAEYSKQRLKLRIVPPEREPKTEAELIAEFEQREELAPLKRIMKAKVQRVIP